jgi:hypothetical protein
MEGTGSVDPSGSRLAERTRRRHGRRICETIRQVARVIEPNCDERTNANTGSTVVQGKNRSKRTHRTFALRSLFTWGHAGADWDNWDTGTLGQR